MRYSRCPLLVLAVAIFPVAAGAEDRALQREVEQLRREVQELRDTVRTLQEILKQQSQAAPAPAAEGAAAPVSQPAVGPGIGKSSAILNPDISFNGDFTFLGTDNNQLNKANRFSFREAEIGFQAPIDPFARADAFVTFGEGESAEVEEAYATFLTLPYNVQARAGKLRLSFGKNNLLHRHALPQTDRPLAAVVNFGEEGTAGTGVGLSYLVPNPWDQYFLLTGEAVNGLGEEGTGGQGIPAEQRPAARAFRDFAYLGHAQSFFDLNADNNIELGGSALLNLPKSGTQTQIYGVDLTYRWRPLGQAGYRQFLWRTEGFFTRQQVRGVGGDTFNTMGFYTYGEYRLTQRLWAGTRADWTEIPRQRRQTEWGVSPYCTFSPTEFGYFRLGYQYAESDRLREKRSNRVWLQYDFSIGPHAAHAF